jgi:hypothetical protein
VGLRIRINPELPASWRQALGEYWKALQEEWLHRLGTLTLTGQIKDLSARIEADVKERDRLLIQREAESKRRNHVAQTAVVVHKT